MGRVQLMLWSGLSGGRLEIRSRHSSVLLTGRTEYSHETTASTRVNFEGNAVCCAGKLMADAAAAAGVKVFVFSTLENVDKRSEVRPRQLQTSVS